MTKKVMSPSDKLITKGQIGKWCDVLANALVKSGLLSEPTQQVLESQGVILAKEFVSLVRKRVELLTNLLVRHVTVDRTRTPQEALNATGRRQYIDSAVVATMPRGRGETVEARFCQLGYCANEEELDTKFAAYLRSLGLNPDEYELLDPITLAKVNEDDPTFADTHPNGTHWKDANGKWFFAAFDQWSDERRVRVGRNVRVGRDGNDWDDYWWFGWRRK